MRLEEVRIRVVSLAHRAKSDLILVLLLLLYQFDQMRLAVALCRILHSRSRHIARKQVRVIVLNLIGLGTVAPALIPLLCVPFAIHGLVVLSSKLLEEELIGAQFLRNFLHLFQAHGLLRLLMEEGGSGG